MPNSELDLVVAGTADAVLMVESEAKELSEQVMLGAVMFGHRRCSGHRGHHPARREGRQGTARNARCRRHAALPSESSGLPKPTDRRRFQIPRSITAATASRRRAKAAAEIVGRAEGKIAARKFKNLFHDLEAERDAHAVLDTGRRIDGRDLKTVRPIVARWARCRAPTARRCSPAARPRRSCVATLGTGEDEQFVDSLEGTYKQTSCSTTTSRPTRWAKRAA